MKAIACTSLVSPDTLRLVDKEKPTPKAGEVLVKVYAASVNALDWRPFTMPAGVVRLIGALSGMRPTGDETAYGADMAGLVEAVGADVRDVRPGDAVFGSCRGAFAEYVCTSSDRVAPKPPNVSFETAAAVSVAGLTALQALRDHGRLQAGQRVLINGAGGGVGSFAVQIARMLGGAVTAVCGPHNVEAVRAMGADHVVDYTREDVTRNGQQYDLIIAVNGYHSLFDYLRALRPGGRCVVVGGSWGQLIQGMFLGSLLTRFAKAKVLGMMTRPNRADRLVLAELLANGSITPPIDRRYRLDEVPEAIKYLMTGHTRGKVVITVA